jgi:RIO kinase 1
VFDDATFAALYKLVQDGWIDAFGGPISTGKEANVYTALGGDRAAAALAAGADALVDEGGALAAETGEPDGANAPESEEPDGVSRSESGPEVAVKVYRINASDFRDMRDYLTGDPRFEGIGGKKSQVVLAWVRKEYANLKRAAKAGVRVPQPLAVERNVLVMEYIGTDEGGRARRLAEVDVENPETAYHVVREYVRRLYTAGLVHGDLSEYNMVIEDGELVVIDLGQAVTVHHPNSDDFLRRDCRNVANFFSRQGLSVTGEDCYEFVVEHADPTTEGDDNRNAR